MNIVLYQPEIPQNTGNIARLCAVTGTSLHLIRPLGFSVDDRSLKRAGLDYWHMLDIHYYDSLDELYQCNSSGRFFYITKKVSRLYTEQAFCPGDFFVFGRETKGLPQAVLDLNKERCLRIPMLEHPGARSLNLSNSVAVVLYEALRQQNFCGLV